MYIGTIGIIQAVRKPSTILVLSSGRMHGNIKGKRLIMPVNMTIGHYNLDGALALFDTGSNETVVCLKDGKHRIGLDPEGDGYIRGIDGDLKQVFYYDAELKFSSHVSVSVGLVSVYEGDFDIADIIIGMDIISQGRLTVDGQAGTFTFEI